MAASANGGIIISVKAASVCWRLMASIKAYQRGGESVGHQHRLEENEKANEKYQRQAVMAMVISNNDIMAAK